MPKRQELPFQVSFQGKEVKCKAQRADLVTVGLEGTWPKRLTIKKKVGENAEAAALRSLAMAYSSVAAIGSQECSQGPALSKAPSMQLFSDVALFLSNASEAVGIRREVHIPDRYVPSAPVRDQCESSGKRRQDRKAVQSHQKAQPGTTNRIGEERFANDCSNPSCVRSRADEKKLKRKLDAMQTLLSRLCSDLDRSCDGLNATEVIAVQHLQHALMELLDYEEGEDEPDADEKNNSTVQANISSSSTTRRDEIPTRAGDGFQDMLDEEQVVPARILASHSGVQGELFLHNGELSWVEHGKQDALLRISISDVSSFTTAKVICYTHVLSCTSLLCIKDHIWSLPCAYRDREPTHSRLHQLTSSSTRGMAMGTLCLTCIAYLVVHSQMQKLFFFLWGSA